MRSTILVADDDFYMRGLVKVALDGVGEIIEADSGEAVLDLYKKHSPAIVLLDIHMPKKGGKMVLEEILAHDPLAYVVMFSADAQMENVHGTTKNGAKGFIVKPFTKDKLLEYVLRCPSLAPAAKSKQA